VLRYFTAHSSYQDIAAVCAIAVSTVRSRLRDARSALRLALRDAATAAYSDANIADLTPRRDAEATVAAGQRGDFARLIPDLYHRDASVILSGRLVGDMRSILVMMDYTHSSGVRKRVRDVAVSGDVMVWETEFLNPSHNPDHCPPGLVWLHNLRQGRTHRRTPRMDAEHSECLPTSAASIQGHRWRKTRSKGLHMRNTQALHRPVRSPAFDCHARSRDGLGVDTSVSALPPHLPVSGFVTADNPSHNARTALMTAQPKRPAGIFTPRRGWCLCRFRAGPFRTVDLPPTQFDLEPFGNANLRTLVLQSGGLPGKIIRSVAASDLLALTDLELWLSYDYDGGDARPDDFASIVSGHSLPLLTSLGLCNSEITDDYAEALAAAPATARLTRLDLSLGTFSDAGAEALLAGQPLTHLISLNLQHHWMTKDDPALRRGPARRRHRRLRQARRRRLRSGHLSDQSLTTSIGFAQGALIGVRRSSTLPRAAQAEWRASC
jgi:hypothetical protein